MFKQQVEENDWYLTKETNMDENLNILFKENISEFKYFGGDIERLLTNIKIAHSRRVFGKQMNVQKLLTYHDIKNGLEKMIKTKHESGENINQSDNYCNSMYT